MKSRHKQSAEITQSSLSRTSMSDRSNESTSSIVGRMIEHTKSVDAVWAGRLLFVACLCVVAAVLGFLGHHILDDAETKLAIKQFGSIADRALVAAHQITQRKQRGAVTLASVVGNHLPDPEPWPFVTFSNMEEIAQDIIATSDGRSMGFAPFVLPEQLAKFEEFAYNYYDSRGFPNTTGVSSFGKGVWGKDSSLNTSDNRYWTGSGGGKSSWGSPYSLHVPMLQHSRGVAGVLMLDCYYHDIRGRIIDSFIDKAREDRETGRMSEYGGMTDFLSLVTDETPSAIMMQPIRPANNRTELTGIIASSIAWRETLLDVFNDEVRGIHCVLCSNTACNTYSIWDGKVAWDGKGDLHQKSYQRFAISIELTGGDQHLTNVSASYNLTMYPTKAFFNVYSTGNPTIATIGAVGAILLTSLLFFLYDMFVRRDIRSKQNLLEAKRAFVRFVSHEVRTPLNSVMMGLTFLQEEMAKSLGHRSVEEIDATDPEAQPLSPSTASSLLNGNGHSVHKRDVLHFFRQSQEIHGNTQRAVSVLNDLLTYDKVEMGSMQLELDVVTLPPLIELTANEFTAAAAQKKIKFTIDFSDLKSELEKLGSDGSNDQTPPPFFYPKRIEDCRSICDDIRIAQVVRNLISNAIKFTREGGVISLRASYVMPNMSEKKGFVSKQFTLKRGEEISAPPSGSLRLDVSDSGAGMTNKQLEVVFGDGVQFNANDLQKGNGTGLGLHIAKGIMDLHHGKLTAASEGLNKGTTFSMVTPLYHLPDTGNKGIKEDTQPSNSENQEYLETGPLRLLVVDDARMNRKLLSRLLKNHDHICEEADDGDVAVDMVRMSMEEGTPFDTVLLDNEMPRLSGPLAARQMREMGSDVFIVGVTGNLLPDDVEEFKKSGANAVLPKPFKLASLEQLWVEYGISSDSQRQQDRTTTNGDTDIQFGFD